jgi:hypothetical protein
MTQPQPTLADDLLDRIKTAEDERDQAHARAGAAEQERDQYRAQLRSAEHQRDLWETRAKAVWELTITPEAPRPHTATITVAQILTALGHDQPKKITDSTTVAGGPGSSRRAQDAPAPSQGQEIPAEQFTALWEQMLGDPGGIQDKTAAAIRGAYRIGFAAALGYEITIEDGRVGVGDRPGSAPAPPRASYGRPELDHPTGNLAAAAVGPWHFGRAWAGSAIEDVCPCPQEPCGLVSTSVPECEQHTRNRTVRQGHPASRCPGQRQDSLTGKVLALLADAAPRPPAFPRPVDLLDRTARWPTERLGHQVADQHRRRQT